MIILHPIASMIVDMTILLLTWAKTWDIYQLVSRAGLENVSIGRLLLRDGECHAKRS